MSTSNNLAARRIITATILGLLLFLGSSAFLFRYTIACESLPHLAHDRIDEQIFMANDIDSENLETLIRRVAAASQRIAEIYGTPESRPRILVTSNSRTAGKWGANNTASMHRTPWRSCIILGPDGQNIDVIAHEWLHAEIQHRVGFWRFLMEVPVWFDEGAALTVDHREPYLPENIELPDEQIIAVQSLVKARDFFSGNIRENYQAARMAVAPLIDATRFYDDLGRLADGQSFDDVFMQSLAK